MLDTVLPVPEIGRHGSFVKPYIHTKVNRQLHRLQGSQGSGPGYSPFKWKGPVIAVVRDSQNDFLRRNLAHRILHYPSHHIDGGHGHGRSLTVSPLVGHQHDVVSRLPQQPVINALIEKPPLLGRSLRRKGYRNRIAEDVEYLGSPAHKISILRPVFCQHILKVNIQTPISLFLHRAPQLPDKALLVFPASHQD